MVLQQKVMEETKTESAKWILHDISYRGIYFNPSNWTEEGVNKTHN